VANSRPAYWPPGGWPPKGRNWCFQLLSIGNVVSKHDLPDRGIRRQFGARRKLAAVNNERNFMGINDAKKRKVNSLIRETMFENNITN
jgi:hypothetical protein